MAEMKFELVFVNTNRASESIPVGAEEITIGRSRSNTVVLDDQIVSRRHLAVRRTGDNVIAEDCGSSHGTFLNDKRVRGSVSLKDGDVLQLGEVKFRFTAIPVTAEGEKTRFAEGPQQAVQDGTNATGFAQASGGDETKFMPQEEPGKEAELDKTRVIGDGETRIMNASELKGLRAAPAAPLPRRKKLLIALLCLLLAAAASVFLVKGKGRDAGSGKIAQSHTDEAFALTVGAPAGWKLTQGSDGAIFGFEYTFPGSRQPARMNVFGDRSAEFAATGLQAAFESYRDTILERHEGARMQGHKVMTVNNAVTVFYGFTGAQEAGKGLFLLSGSQRICVECSAAPAASNLLVNVFPAMLRTLRLNQPQQCIDFPPPSEPIRKLALSNKDHLQAMSKKDLDLGRELLKNRDVRPENLYLAKQALQRCLTTASALGERPAFYTEAAARLSEASRALDEALRDQKFKIVIAENKHDVEQAYWESVKLSQMMPDKTSDVYQFAAKRVDFYSKRRER